MCPHQHTFDRAREGYVNLLVSGRKSSGSTSGDTPDSLAARRRFLHGGWYQPISDALTDALGTIDGPVLDVGCGEGYYLSRVSSSQPCGLDISKRAVQMTSKIIPDGEFVVASAYRLPVVSQSCGAVFSVFSPYSLDEFRRVLQPHGKWVTVSPGPHHLKEMRPKRDEKVEEREQRRTGAPDGSTTAQRLTFELELTDEAAIDLYSMTPLRWQASSQEAVQTVRHVTVDVWIAMS